MKRMLIFCIITLLASQCFGEIINIPEDFETIQAGIDASEDGDTVLVQPGEYVENINFNGHNVVVFGNPDDPAEVVIDGSGEGSVVQFENNEGRNSVLRGFTLTNGRGNGAGILCFSQRDETSPTLEDLIIINNDGTGSSGGGIHIRQGSPLINRCTISDNLAAIGAGIAMYALSAPILNDVVISNNVSSSAGGGIYGDIPGEFRFNRVLIANNRSTTYGGGGVFLWYTTRNGGVMENVTIIGNNAIGENGAICVIAPQAGEGVPGGQAVLTLVNAIIRDNNEPTFMVNGYNEERMSRLSISYSDIENGRDAIFSRNEFVEIEWGEGNIDEDPLFVDPDAGDYQLTEDSPCIDAGDPESGPDPDETRADMGAYYFFQDPELIPRRLNVPDEYETIQAAIDASDPGDTVLVAPGEYVENIELIGRQIIVASLLITTGDTDFIESTIINGNEAGSVVTFDEEDASTLQGFTIANGSAERWGGGIYCQDSSPFMLDLVVEDNWARDIGGGIYCALGSPRLNNVIIQNNRAGNGNGTGGGFGEIRSTPSLTNVIIRDNTAGELGGGIVAFSGTIILENVAIVNNSARSCPGVDIFRSTGNLFTNVTIARNIGEREIAALGVRTDGEDDGRSELMLVNCIIYGNRPGRQLAVYAGFEENPGSILTVSHCDIEGGENEVFVGENSELNWGEGNINEDPLFDNPENGDYHLTENSPCIDSGDPESDPDPDGTRADMGAFYFFQEPNQNPPGQFDLLEPADLTEERYEDRPAFNINFTWQNSVDPDPLGSVSYLARIVLEMWNDEDSVVYYHAIEDTSILLNLEEDFWRYFQPGSFLPVHWSVAAISQGDTIQCNSVFNFTMIANSGVKDEDKIPVSFKLDQPYPNPFNSSTTISYSIPAPSSIKLQIFDINSKVVETLMDGFARAGKHETKWDATGLTSGLYFVRIEAGDNCQLRKTILVK